MNGAESLVRTLVAGGVEVCFTNPGTSELHVVAALGRVNDVRSVLCLFEGVATGAADGYARMADKPAATLLHLGPGLMNGLANLHNAKRARSPVLNIVGDHTVDHRRFDSPLTSDLESIARPYSDWLKTSIGSHAVASDGAEAIAAARTAPGRIATLILPADAAWGDAGSVAAVPKVTARTLVSEAKIIVAAEALRSGQPTLFLLGDRALRSQSLHFAARIAKRTGARLLAETANARVERGAGRVPIERIPYQIDDAVKALAEVEHLILVGAKIPVSFFAYPGKRSEVAPPACHVHSLAEPEDDQLDALTRLADEIGVRHTSWRLNDLERPLIPSGRLDADTVGAVVGALLPENAIICDESVTTGRRFFAATAGARPHDWLQLSGGAIGLGIPMAVGAAVACPERKVISLQADGSGMYSLQGLWTQAREKLNVLTVIWSNRSYAILKNELTKHEVGDERSRAWDLVSLSNPEIDWTSLARGLGVEASRATTVEEFAKAFRSGITTTGPCLIEVILQR